MSNMKHTSFKTAKELDIKDWERYELERLIPDLEAENVRRFNMAKTHRCIAGNIYKRRNIFARIWACWSRTYIMCQPNPSLRRLYLEWKFPPTNQKAAAAAIRHFLTTGTY